MTKRIYVVAESNYAGCCGVREICGFMIHSEGDQGGWALVGSGATVEDAWTVLLKQAKNLNAAFIHVWFVMYPNYNGNFEGQEYANEPFRKLVKRIKGVIALGEAENPNTSNMIDGYMWVNSGEVEFNAE